MGTIKDKCAIVGIGQTEFSRNSGRSELRMALEAITQALDDAGLTPKDVDGIMRFGMDAAGDEAWIATNLGVPNMTFWGIAGQGGSSGCGLIAHAASAIVAGQANCVVCFRSLNGYSAERYGTAVGQKAGQVGIGSGWEPIHEAFAMPFGLVSPAQSYAMMARRHMHEYGTTYEQLGAIAVTFRKYAQMNPRAISYGRPLTMEAYLKGRMICDPLRVYDCAIETDGACAVVVTSAERARDLKQRPAYIMAACQAAGPTPYNEGLSCYYRPVITETPSKYVAQKVYEIAGISPKDVDVAQLYDCFSISALVQIEDYGFCKKGEGGPFVEAGNLELDGAIPMNTSGGHLGEGYIHGFTHILEGVRQIRGTSTAQVQNAEIALVSSGVPTVSSAMILRR